MAVNLLTPSLIWEKITIDSCPKIEPIGEYKDGSVVFSRFYLISSFGKGKQAKIYCSLARDVNKKTLPTIFVVQDFNDGADESILRYYVKKGYAVFTFDIAGECEGNTNRTIYSSKLEYANRKSAGDNFRTVESDVVHTCWHVWATVCKQALAYIKEQDFVSGLGAIGIGEASTALWQLVAFEDGFDCAVFVKNAGWQLYNKYFKFGEDAVPRFSDGQMAYVAGVEAQNYAPNIDCPTLVLSPTNSAEFNLDRAKDTATRIDKKTYSAVSYSVGMRDSVGKNALINTQMFLEKYLQKKDKIVLPNDMELKTSLSGGKILVSVFPDEKGIEDVCLYYAEQTIDPALRCWNKLNAKNTENGYVFEIEPFSESQVVIYFARAQYKNGFTICSAVYAKRFLQEEAGTKHKSNIVYSSREEGGESIFAPATENVVRPTGVNFEEERSVNVVQGPDEIFGVSCAGGVLTFNINTKKSKPSEDAMLLFDAYMKKNGALTVKLISDYLGNKTEYFALENINGGEIWQKICLDKSRFKTLEGRPLRSYGDIEAIEIDAEGHYLLNNILWV